MTKSTRVKDSKLIDKVRVSVNRIVKDALVVMNDEDVRRYWWVSVGGGSVGTLISEPPTTDGWFFVCITQGHDVVYDNSWYAALQILSEDEATIDRIILGGFRNAYGKSVRTNK